MKSVSRWLTSTSRRALTMQAEDPFPPSLHGALRSLPISGKLSRSCQTRTVSKWVCQHQLWCCIASHCEFVSHLVCVHVCRFLRWCFWRAKDKCSSQWSCWIQRRRTLMSPWRQRYKNLFELEDQVKVKIDSGTFLNFNFFVYVLPVALVWLCWTLLKPRFNHTRVERTPRSKASFSSQVNFHMF